MTFDSPIGTIPLVGTYWQSRLKSVGIHNISDLLYYFPFRYDDFSLVSKVADVQEGEVVTIQGTVLSMKNQYTRGGFVLQQAVVEDETGKIEAIWFNQVFLTRAIHAGDSISLSGKVKRQGKKLQLAGPKYEIMHGGSAKHTARLVPVYSESGGLNAKWLRGRIAWLIEAIKNGLIPVVDTLDQKILDEKGLIDLKTALIQIHYPDSQELADQARKRLAFDELLFAQLTSQIRKIDWQKKTVGNKLDITTHHDKLTKFVDNLPFKLTSAQSKVVNEIYGDLAKTTPMNRLLQGDVGSGKTVVAALALLVSYFNNFQSALMAPTEILANQHYKTLNLLFAPLNIKVGIATGSKKDYEGFDIIVGTHALLSDKVNFSRLGLIVIDEQHRFGVDQRGALIGKGIQPHVLSMTATPIPRTVALTLYGDLDISVIDEMPQDRKTVKTWVVPKEKRDNAYEWIKKQQTQSFIVCPLIEESETMLSVKSAKAEFEKLSKEVFTDLSLGLIHGKLKAKEKDQVLQQFRNKELDILVATPVVEVGIDIPAATIMVIEAADRFGLAQLHQLRGRVGRNDQQSFCLLFTENDQAVTRLKFLENIHNGLKLAETDLKFRGPGQRFGTAQHGRWDFKIADFSDLSMIESASQTAKEALKSPDNFPALHKTLTKSKIMTTFN